MSRVYRQYGQSKADRALELYERGLAPTAIAERLGISPRHVQGTLQRARERRETERREKAKETAE
jgi:DNA-directed RNA polymerase specialized sigma24 family protein